MKVEHLRLINAARNALFQRTKVRRSAELARDNFAPAALTARAKKRATQAVDVVIAETGKGLRKYSIPLGLAAVAGLAFAFRRPLGEAAQAVSEAIGGAADELKARWHDTETPSPETDPAEPKDEPV